jgi:hypothetical protein
VIKQQPAMDHVIQYAALNEVYHAIVDHERQKTTQGRTRRNSLDLHDAFKGAVSDPSNLRLVSHDEHVNNGGSKHTGQFSDSELRNAHTLFVKHLPSVESTHQELAMFHNSRPRSSAPPVTNIFGTSDRVLRPRK